MVCKFQRIIGNSKICIKDKAKPCSNCSTSKDISQNISPTLVSRGNDLTTKDTSAYALALTPKQAKALELYNKKIPLSRIGKELNISKQGAHDLIKRAIRSAQKSGLTSKRMPLTITPKNPLTIRLHNDEFKAKVECNYEQIAGDVKNKGRNLEYKLIKSNEYHIKIHKNLTMTIRFMQDIETKTEDEALIKADIRLKEFIESWNIDNIRITSTKLINRHYGLLGTSMAKRIVDERKMLIIKDNAGKIRLRIDCSKGAEIDTESIETNYDDMKSERKWHTDVMDNPHDVPSITKKRLDFIETDHKFVVDVLNKYAKQMDLHLEVEKETLKTTKMMQESLHHITHPTHTHKAEPIFNTPPKGHYSLALPVTYTKNDYKKMRARKLLDQYGWSAGVWND